MSLKQVANAHFTRVLIPKRLQPTLRRREIIRTLNTTDHETARSIELAINQTLKDVWAQLDDAQAQLPACGDEGAYARLALELVDSVITQQIDFIKATKASRDNALARAIATLMQQNAAPTQHPNAAASESASIRLSELASIRVKQLRATGRASKTLMAAEAQYRQIIGIMGDKPLTDYKHLDFLQLQEQLQKTLAPRTVHARLITTATLFKYATDYGYLKDNPCPRFEKTKALKKANGWQAYNADDLGRLFASPYFPEGRPDHRGWACLISLYSGLRIDEVCQLHSDDIIEQDGILCLSVNDDGDKKVKTLASIRFVPVHTRLIELGIRDLGDGRRLFPQFINEGMGYSHGFSKAYGKFKRRHITQDPQKVFHSYRVTFSHALAKVGVHQETIGAILGHNPQSKITADYTGGVSISAMYEAILRLEYNSGR